MIFQRTKRTCYSWSCSDSDTYIGNNPDTVENGQSDASKFFFTV